MKVLCAPSCKSVSMKCFLCSRPVRKTELHDSRRCLDGKAVFAKADAHLAKPAQIKARDVAAQPPVMTHSGTHPLFGRVRIFEVSKAAVLEMDVASFLDAFDQLSASQDLLESNWMQLRLAFDGWDDDKRESYQIPEIRNSSRPSSLVPLVDRTGASQRLRSLVRLHRRFSVR